MKNKNYFIAAFLIPVFLSACSSLNVVRVDPSTVINKSEGIYYALPRTEIGITLKIERTDKIQGPYSSYASKYLGLSDVISENSTSYKISSVNISSCSIPDPEQYFFIETKRIKKHLMVDLGEYGILTGINKRYSKNVKRNSSDSSFFKVSDFSELSKQHFINPDIAVAFDTIIEKINLDTTVIVKKSLKKVYVEKTTEQKAKEAADLILELEESRLTLLTGYSEVNYSKETIEYMVKKLQDMEDEYLHLFTGVSVTHTQEYDFKYIPAENSSTLNLPLFRFSEKSGISDTSDYKGESVYINVKPSESTDKLNAFEISRLNTKEKHHGIYYRIPEKADIILFYKDKPIATNQLMITQSGAVCELQPKGVKSLSLDPEAGSVNKIFYGKKRGLFFHHH